MTFFGQYLSFPCRRPGCSLTSHVEDACRQRRAAKPKKVVHRLDSDADDISMDDDSGDSDFGAPKKVPIVPKCWSRPCHLPADHIHCRQTSSIGWASADNQFLKPRLLASHSAPLCMRHEHCSMHVQARAPAKKPAAKAACTAAKAAALAGRVVAPPPAAEISISAAR